MNTADAVEHSVTDEKQGRGQVKGERQMFIRGDVYTGGEHYWIRFYNGTHEVRRETCKSDPDNETVFKGTYKECVEWLEKTIKANYEYDHNL